MRDKRDRILQYERIANTSFASLSSEVYALQKFIQEDICLFSMHLSRVPERVHTRSTAPTQPDGDTRE